MKKVMLFFIAAICLTTFFGCEKDKDVELPLTLKSTSTTLTSSQTFNITVTPDTVGCTYESENDLIASVSTNGLITAKRVGETSIVVKNIKKGFTSKFKVTVTPKYSMYKEPYLVFGSTATAIKSYEKRKLNTEDAITLMYDGENAQIMGVGYAVENSIYKLAICAIPKDYPELLLNYLRERHQYIGVLDGDFYFKSIDNKTAIKVDFFTNSYIAVWYFQYTDTSTGVKSAIVLSNLRKTIDNLRLKTKMLSKEK